MILSLLPLAGATCVAPNVAAEADAAKSELQAAHFDKGLAIATSAIERLVCLEEPLVRTDLARLYQMAVAAAEKFDREDLAEAWCRRAAEMQLIAAFDPSTASSSAERCAPYIGTIAGEGMIPWTAAWDGTVDGVPVRAGDTLVLYRGTHVVQEVRDGLHTRIVSIYDAPVPATPTRRPQPASRWVLGSVGVVLAAAGAASLAGAGDAFLDIGRAEGADASVEPGQAGYEEAVQRANALRIGGLAGVGVGAGLVFGAAVWPAAQVTVRF